MQLPLLPLQDALIEEASLQSHLRANIGQNRHYKRHSEQALAAQEGTNCLKGLIIVAAITLCASEKSKKLKHHLR
jgi:hypothetical protein